jgi:sugar phosphate isomerase/epimerase
MGRILPTLHGSQLRGARLTLEEKLAMARRHGYPGLDFGLAEARGVAGGDPGAVQALFERHGVTPSTAGGVLGANLFAPEDEFATALQGVRPNAEAVAALGATRTGTVLMNRAHQPKEELWPLVVERIRRVDDTLDGTGVRLGMEFLGVKTLRPEYPHVFVQSMAEANALLDEAGARNVGLTLDSYHWYAAGDSLDTIRQTAGERIVLLHVNDAKDVPREQLIDSDRVVPGEGVIPLVNWLQAIDATGFDGFIGLEVLGPRLADLDAEACAALGADCLSRLYSRAGLSYG